MQAQRMNDTHSIERGHPNTTHGHNMTNRKITQDHINTHVHTRVDLPLDASDRKAANNIRIRISIRLNASIGISVSISRYD